MSYPPRQPMGMPPMAPGMMPQSYGFAPMGMMPMGMGMMTTPMMRPVTMSSSGTTGNSTTSTTSSSGSSSSATSIKPSKKLVPQEIPKDKKEDKPPVTTVFVGNISDRAPDPMIRQMLQRCGNVLSWKRIQGASGKLQAFGFCEYEYPEATLRCIRLLNEWQIADKKLVVKVDAKTKTMLDEYKKKKKEELEKDKEKQKEKEKTENGDVEEGEEKDEEEGGEVSDLDEFSQREDRVAKAGLDAIMREYAGDLAKEPASGKQVHSKKRNFQDAAAEEKKEKRKEERRKDKKDAETAKDGLEDMELEEEKKDLINREIRSFRDAHKDEEDKEAEKTRERERRRREEERERERERRERERERERRERERERKKKKVPTATLR